MEPELKDILKKYNTDLPFFKIGNTEAVTVKKEDLQYMVSKLTYLHRKNKLNKREIGNFHRAVSKKDKKIQRLKQELDVMQQEYDELERTLEGYHALYD